MPLEGYNIITPSIRTPHSEDSFHKKTARGIHSCLDAVVHFRGVPLRLCLNYTVYFRIADLNILICVQPHEEKVTLGLGSLQETQP